MKINRKESYSIDDLTKDEVLFLFEVIEKLQLSADSSQVSFDIAEKFKAFHHDLFETEESNEDLVCDGCEGLIEVSMVQCPAEETMLPLCPVCLLKRQHLMGINGQQSTSPTS